MNPTRLACVWLAAAWLFAGVASAQPAQPAADAGDETGSGPKWELEFHGGLSFEPARSNGSASLPSTGSTVGGLVSLSTFFFGDGATLFNTVRPASPITSLNPALTAPGIERATGPVIGARLQRTITKRLAIEFNGDYLRNDVRFRTATLSAIEASRASFITALNGTLGPSAAATSVATIVDNQSAPRVMATGNVVLNLRTTGRTIPYIVGGAGMVFNGGSWPTATIQGKYQVGSSSVLYATDTVKLHYDENSHAVVYMGGAGVKHALSDRTGIRVDARLTLYKPSTKNLVDVTPDKQIMSTGQPLPIITTGALQFSALGPLNGPSYSSATTFSPGGLQPQVSATAGFYIRF